MASNENTRPIRKHPVHGILHLPHKPTVIFDTVCTKGRQRWLANEAIHQLLRSIWKDATAWMLGRYVIIPDHVHFFAAAVLRMVSRLSW